MKIPFKYCEESVQQILYYANALASLREQSLPGGNELLISFLNIIDQEGLIDSFVLLTGFDHESIENIIYHMEQLESKYIERY